MSEHSNVSSSDRKTPWHLWVVAILALLWNGAGTYTIMMAQAGRLPGIKADEVAYYAAQPRWFVIATHIALFSVIAAAVVSGGDKGGESPGKCGCCCGVCVWPRWA